MYDELKLQIYIWRCNNGGLHPSMIVMNPATYIDIERELRSIMNSNHERSLTYQGVEILRSEDVPKGKIKIA